MCDFRFIIFGEPNLQRYIERYDMASVYNIKIEAGATFTRTIVWRDSDGNIMDLNGFTARMQIRQQRTSSVVSLEATTENGKIVINGDDGEIVITFSATETSELTISAGVYDLELISSEDVVTRLLEGSVSVSPEVTR